MAGMLWCEQWWTLLPVLSDSCCSSEAAEPIKWLLSVTWSHTICFHINWLHPAGKGTEHPFAYTNGRRHTCSWVVACFLPLSHAILVRLSAAWSATLSPTSHIKAVLSVPLVAKWLRGGGKSGKVGAFQEEFSKSRAGSEKWLFGWCGFLSPASHNYIFCMCKSHFLSAWVTPISSP